MKAFKLLLIAGLALLALSCQKTEKTGGQEIRFSASATPQTKTAYGDYDNPGNPSKQDINWIEGDQILIVSDKAVKRYDANQHYSVYDIVDIDPSSLNKAKLDNPASDPNGLTYVEGEETYNFVAFYPPTQELTAYFSAFPSTDPLKITIPANQAPKEAAVADQTTGDVTLPADMSLAYMVAGAGSKPWMAYHDYTETINLPFYPAFTAFEITLRAVGVTGTKAGETRIPVTSVKIYAQDDQSQTSEEYRATPILGSGNLAGKFTPEISFTGGAPTFETSDYEPLVYTFPEGTNLLAATNLTFTVFALPKTYNGLTMEITLGDGQIRTATLTNKSDGSPIEFEACKKNRLYVLAVPNGFKMFTTEEELHVAELQEQTSDIIF